MKRCIIYINEENEERAEKQLEDISALIYQEGEREIKTIIRETSFRIKDPEEREEFDHILQLAKKNQFDELWIYDAKSVTQDLDLLGYVKILLKKRGIVYQNVEEKKKKNAELPPKLEETQKQLKKYRKNRYKGMKKRLEQKKVMSRPPFGYKVEQGELVVDESKRALIRRILSEVDKPFTSLKMLSEKYNLSVSRIRHIRNNPIYRTGEVRWAGKIAYYVEPIVPESNNQKLELDEGS